MGLSGLIFACIPGIAFSLWFLMECPIQAKVIIHKLPVFISSTLVACVIGTVSAGVIGSYAGFVCDLILIPVMWYDKHKIVEPYVAKLENDQKRAMREAQEQFQPYSRPMPKIDVRPLFMKLRDLYNKVNPRVF